MAIHSRLIEYLCGDTLLEGRLFWDDTSVGPQPAVAVAHTWAGRGAFEEGRAQSLAEAGYVGFAVDLYGKGVRGTTPEENTALMTPLLEDRATLQARIAAAIVALREQDEVAASKVAAIGFCFGGLTVLDLARAGSDVLGVASFHGLFMPADNLPAPSITAKVLCLHGYDDPMAAPEAMTALGSELSESGADWQIHAYGNTLHAFTNPEANAPEMGMGYSEAADRRSAQALQNFLDEIFS
ncbi:MAG: dienelactone hydrolase family protein [Halioglobus sp.]